jgi:antitoxin PrlF
LSKGAYNLQTTTSKGQVTIPIAIRRKLGITPGNTVRFVQRGDEVLLEKVESDVASIFGMLKASGTQSLAQLKQTVSDEAKRRHDRD